jgi:hypothetical protein
MDTKTLVSVGVAVFSGAFLVLLGADIIPQRVFKPNVPSWLLVVIGLALVLAGTSVFFRVGSPIANRMIGVCLLLMAAPFFWVALFGDPRHMSGGIPFLSDQCNLLLARFAFGFFALIWLWLGVLGLRYARHQPGERAVESDQ